MQVDVINNVILNGADSVGGKKKNESRKIKSVQAYETVRSEYAEIINKVLEYSGADDQMLERIRKEMIKGLLDNSQSARSAAEKIVETGI